MKSYKLLLLFLILISYTGTAEAYSYHPALINQSYQDSSDNSDGGIGTGTGQTFTAYTDTIGAISIFIRQLNPASRSATIKLWDSTSKNTLLGSVTQSMGYTSTVTEMVFAFSPNVTVTPGTQYYWEYTDATPAEYDYYLHFQSTDIYSGGDRYTGATPVITTTDFAFKVYGEGMAVGNWTFNEGSGTWANDTSGYDNNAEITGASWTTNLVGGSVNGSALNITSSDAVNATTSASLNISEAITISTWVIPHDTLSAATVKGLLSKCTDSVSGTCQYSLYWYSNKLYLHGAIDIISTEAQTWSAALAYIQVTYDNSSGIARIYKNGELIKSNTLAGQLGKFNGANLNFTNSTNATVDETIIYNYVRNTSERTADYQRFHPVPAYPVGGITISGTYPPLTSTINFTWHDTEYLADRLTIAEDSGFNIIAHDSYYSTDYALVELEAGTYYWKVQQYDSTNGTFGDTSAAQTFTLTSTAVSSDGTTGINGIIYEVTPSGSKIPLSGAQVFIYNSTWSSAAITGSNGYYIFSGLANESLYSLKATKNDYLDSNIELVTTVNGTWITKDIQLQKCLSGFTCFYTQEYQDIIVKWDNGTAIYGATVNIYKDNEVVTTSTTTTDSYGYTRVLLTKDQRYRITVTKAEEGVSHTEYFYPITAPYIIEIGIIAYATPTATPFSNVTSYNVTYDQNHTWAVQNFTSSYLNSSIGLGMLGQGTLAGIVNWLVVGAGGWLATIFTSAVMAYLGVMSWVTILFFALTAISLHVLTRM